jgi:hypothetical protein
MTETVPWRARLTWLISLPVAAHGGIVAKCDADFDIRGPKSREAISCSASALAAVRSE